MVTYEVTTMVESRAVEAFERYMRQVHIPHLLATGCFQEAAFDRSTPGRYRTRYEARSQAELDRYLATHAARLREEFVTRFPEGVAVSRETWVGIQSWAGPSGPSGLAG